MSDYESKSAEKQFDPNRAKPSNKLMFVTITAILGILGGMFYFTSDGGRSSNNHGLGAAGESRRITNNIEIGGSLDDRVTELSATDTGDDKTIFFTVTESGRAVVFAGDWQVLGEADNPTTDAASELPGSVTALQHLQSNFYLGGTGDGKFNLYQLQDFRLVASRLIDEFRDSGINDPVAGSGSVTHVLLTKNKKKAVVINYDGLGRLYDVEHSQPIFIAAFELSAGVVAAETVGEQEIWFLTADGRVSVYQFAQINRAGLAFDVNQFGKLKGADFAHGRFLIFGHSLDVKTASIAVYSKTGKLEQILTKSGANTNNDDSLEDRQLPVTELPNISDLGESFADAEWLDENRIAAIKDQSFYLLDLNDKKAREFVLPLKFGETVERFVRASRTHFLFGTSHGRVFEQIVEL